MGKFKCWKSEKDGQWYFHLRADNDEIIVQSEGYETKDGCLNGVNSVKHNAPNADVEVEE
jgi:uncharacterized protein YegP (UPF0339 family)